MKLNQMQPETAEGAQPQPNPAEVSQSQPNPEPAVDASIDQQPEEVSTPASYAPPAGQEEEKKNSVPLTKILRLYVVPLGSIAIFFGILGLLVIPAVSKVFSTLDEIAIVNEESVAADETLSQLQSLASNQAVLENDLNLIRNLAPADVTQVTDFQRKIVDMAEDEGLEVTEATLEETILAVEGEDATAKLGLIEIPSRFTVKGTLDELKTFVAEIQSITDFVIIGEMTLRTNQVVNSENYDDLSGDDWVLAITLVKYQFQIPDEINQLEAFYRNVPPTVTLDQDVIDFANQKYTVETDDGEDSFFNVQE